MVKNTNKTTHIIGQLRRFVVASEDRRHGLAAAESDGADTTALRVESHEGRILVHLLHGTVSHRALLHDQALRREPLVVEVLHTHMRSRHEI
jgi:hypothetical protein